MVCSRCGAEFDEPSGICPVCGNKNIEKPDNNTRQQNNDRQQSDDNHQPDDSFNQLYNYLPDYNEYKQPDMESINLQQSANTARTLGILSIVFAAFTLSGLSWILSYIGVAKANKVLACNPLIKSATKGKTLCIVGFFIAYAFFIVRVVLQV